MAGCKSPAIFLKKSQDFMEQVNRYYSVWQEYNYAYEEWAKAHGISVNSLLTLSAIYGRGKDCTQRKSVKDE